MRPVFIDLLDSSSALREYGETAFLRYFTKQLQDPVRLVKGSFPRIFHTMYFVLCAQCIEVLVRWLELLECR